MLIKKQLFNTTHIKPVIGEEVKISKNTYSELTADFIEGAINNGLFESTVSDDEVKEMLSNPEDNLSDISNLLMYYFISNGDIYNQYTLMKSLPDLKYKVGAFDSTIKRYELSMSEITKTLHKVRYKELSRDLIGQACVSGGVVCMWVGNKKNPFLYIFDDLEYVFPRYRVNGDWSIVVDLEWLKQMNEAEREVIFANLSPYITDSQFKTYENDDQNPEKKYIELPQDRACYIKGDSLKRNQRIGIPVGTQTILPLLHKELLINLEKSVSNRVMKNIGILTIGNDEEGKSYTDVPPNVRKQIAGGVGRALKQNTQTSAEQIPVVSLPEFAKLEFNRVDNLDSLKPDKFEMIDKQISNSTGVSSAFTDGSTGNYATAKINESYLYKRIGLLLEQIENVFEKMFKLVLPKNVADNFYFQFLKEQPVSTEKELDTLMQLTAMGWSPKGVIDKLPSVNFDDYLEESLYLQELKIYDNIVPPQTSYTMTSEAGNDKSKDEIEDPVNDNTAKAKTSDGNATPRPNV